MRGDKEASGDGSLQSTYCLGYDGVVPSAAAPDADSGSTPTDGYTALRSSESPDALWLRRYFIVGCLLGGFIVLLSPFVSCSIGSGDELVLPDHLKNRTSHVVSWEACWDEKGPSSFSRIVAQPTGAAMFAQGIALSYPYFIFVQIEILRRFLRKLELDSEQDSGQHTAWTVGVYACSGVELLGALVCSGVAMVTSATDTIHSVGFVVWAFSAFATSCLVLALAVRSGVNIRAACAIDTGFGWIWGRIVAGAFLGVGLIMIKWGVAIIDKDVRGDDYKFRLFELIYLAVHVVTSSGVVCTTWNHVLGNREPRVNQGDHL
tara:strand:+ start:1176 stop:2132 length:957 start_codon:yes stop_codon:yes gene_type:complete